MGRFGIRLVALGWSVSLSLHALPTYADTSQSFGDFSGEGLQSLGGLAQSAEADLFTGSLTLSVPIVIPPGRKSTTPELKLVYSSTAGDGPFGHGWSLPLGSVERSTKHGVPRCNAPDPNSRTDHTNDFILNLNGAVQELVPVSGTASYRVKIDEGFIEAIADPTNNRWEVTDRAGMKYTFGLDSDARLYKGSDTFFDEGSCSFTSVWYLARVEDPNGNRIEIEYQEPSGSDAHYPQTVSYGGTASGGAHIFQITFVLDDRASLGVPRSLSYRRGVKEQWDRVVKTIEVEANGSPVRSYVLDYQGCSDTSRTLLCSVEGDPSEGEPDKKVPTQSFEYSTDEFGHYPCAALESRGYVIPPGTCDHAAFNTNTIRKADGQGQLDRTAMDLNGDGFVDLVQATGASGLDWALYEGGPGGIPDAALDQWEGRSSAVDPDRVQDRLPNQPDPNDERAYVARDTVDLTGDGIPDYVDGRNVNTWMVYPGGVCDALGCGFSSTAIPFSGIPFFDGPEASDLPIPGHVRIRFEDRDGEINHNGTEHYTRRRLADFNGDGLLDIVDSHSGSGSHRHVFLNAGVAAGANPPTGAFEEAPDLQHTSYGRAVHQEEIVSDFRNTITDLFDFNGDGLADILIRASGAALTELKVNKGGGDFTNFWSSAEPIEIRSINKDSQDTVIDFVDMNADGLPDHVRKDGVSGWRVRLNTGTTLAAEVQGPEELWPGGSGPIRNDTKSGNAKKDLFDWNGDGLLDIVPRAAPGGSCSAHRAARPHPGCAPGSCCERTTASAG